MKSSALEQTNPEKNQIVEPKTLPFAPLPARALAAIVDYIVILAVSFFATSQGLRPELHFVLLLIVSAIYFTLSHSEIFHGATVGKRVFGLKVVFSKASNNSFQYLNLHQSFTRYILFYGAMIIFAELPGMLFRYFDYAGPVWQLTLPSIGAFFFVFASAFAVIGTKTHRGLHDRQANAVVVRAVDDSGSEIAMSTPSSEENDFRFKASQTLAITFALGLWYIGMLFQSSSWIRTEQYRIENRFPVFLLDVNQHSANTFLRLGLTEQKTYEKAQVESIAYQIIDFLKKEHPSKEIAPINIEFLSPVNKPISIEISKSDLDAKTQKDAESDAK